MKNYFIIFGLVLFSNGALISCTESTPVKTEQTTPTQKPANKPSLNVPIPNLVFADDVKKYMREVLSAPLPADYVLPADILSKEDYDYAVGKVSEHYPQFVELENEALLRAVKANPALYQEMMLEARAVREHYFPGSQPKLKQ